jgi:hypothetical protein
MHVHMHIHVHLHVFVYVYTPIHVHTHVHTHVYTPSLHIQFLIVFRGSVTAHTNSLWHTLCGLQGTLPSCGTLLLKITQQSLRS